MKIHLILLLLFINRISAIEPEVTNYLNNLDGISAESDHVTNLLRIEALIEKPRIHELARRVGFENNVWGDFENKDSILYSQIDKNLFLNENIHNGIVAARITQFGAGQAISINLWSRRKLQSDELTKSKWLRQMPNKIIDPSNPQSSWIKSEENTIYKSNDLSIFEKVLNDPMPPTVIPVHLKQVDNLSVILEFVVKSDDGLMYKWAIRSRLYTDDYDKFLEVWNNFENEYNQ